MKITQSIFDYGELDKLFRRILEWKGAWAEYILDMKEYDERVFQQLKKVYLEAKKKREENE